DGKWRSGGGADGGGEVGGSESAPAEIETVLRGHHAVTEGVVVADGEDADRRLIAYVLLADESVGIPTAELRAMTAAALPDYLIPAVFVELAALPLTASGKVDRAALPGPDQTRPELAEGF